MNDQMLRAVEAMSMKEQLELAEVLLLRVSPAVWDGPDGLPDDAEILRRQSEFHADRLSSAPWDDVEQRLRDPRG